MTNPTLFKLTKSLFLASSIAIFCILPGCKKTSPATTTTISPSVGTVVVNNVTATASFKEIQGYSTGTQMKIRLNRYGTEVREYVIYFESTSTANGENLIYCQIPDKAIGHGDSGSPIFTRDGRLAGVLCYGNSGANNQFAARAIDDVLSITNNVNTSVNTPLTTNTLITPVYFMSGVNQTFLNRYKTTVNNSFLSQYNIYDYSSSLLKSSIKSSTKSNSPLIGGMSIGVIESWGDLYTSGGVGTIAYVDVNSNAFAFGHQYSNTPPLAAWVFVANGKSFVNSSVYAYKQADPDYNNVVGAMTINSNNGIFINSSQQPITYNTKIYLNTFGVIDSASQYNSNNKYVKQEYINSALDASYIIYNHLNNMPGKYVNVKAMITTIMTLNGNEVTKKDSAKFNTFTPNVDIDLNNVLNDKFLSYDITYHIKSMTMSLILSASTHADSLLIKNTYQ